MAKIYNKLINNHCVIDFGNYTALNWKVFLIFEDDEFVFFLRNEKIGFANKKEIKQIMLSSSRVNKDMIDCSGRFSSFEDIQQYFANKLCKLQTKGTFFDIDLVKKIKISSLQSACILGNIKGDEVIIDIDRVVYVLEI